MAELAIIGGTGLTQLKNLEIERREVLQTPYGEPSAPLTHGKLCGAQAVFLPRHGNAHTIPPHQVNYRANIWALHHIGVKRIIAVAAVGGITSEMSPARIVFPNQIVDYTYGREQTFYDGSSKNVTHIDFTNPYCEELRDILITGAEKSQLDAVTRGTYAATQGPRLETAAEIDRLERDGCDIVGMTGMPEAALARELGLCYATCGVVANWGAGRGGDEISMDELEATLKDGMEKVRNLLEVTIPML